MDAIPYQTMQYHTMPFNTKQYVGASPPFSNDKQKYAESVQTLNKLKETLQSLVGVGPGCDKILFLTHTNTLFKRNGRKTHG